MRPPTVARTITAAGVTAILRPRLFAGSVGIRTALNRGGQIRQFSFPSATLLAATRPSISIFESSQAHSRRTFFSSPSPPPRPSSSSSNEFVPDEPVPANEPVYDFVPEPAYDLAAQGAASSTAPVDALNTLSSTVLDATSNTVAAATAAAQPSLQSLGLAQTWVWPSDICQHLLDIVHSQVGLPWWGTIILTTVTARLLLFPIYMKSSDMTARVQQIQPEIQELSHEFANGDKSVEEFVAGRKAIMEKHGIRQRWVLAPLFVNLIFGFGMLLGIEYMAVKGAPGFATEGTAWFPDLSARDPYLGLHFITATLLTAAFKFGGEVGINTMGPKFMRIMLVLPFASILFTMGLPSAVMLYFSASSVCSIGQTYLLRSAWFRTWARMAPMVKPAAPSAASQQAQLDLQKQFNMMLEAAKKAANQKGPKPPLE
ncbi:60Kd inner membrane protein-domain-containing protein [Myxozyma melibiosi]|uniref:60Kd inner membrane protein-domain-containing protein n=1 Tax=Myxozyma melibiosi TaxID=54550 RepID=A0ABR1F3T9_9ASCO